MPGLVIWTSVAAATAPAGDWYHANVASRDETLAAGDFDGDGHDDLLVQNPTTGSADLYEGSAAGLALQPRSIAPVLEDPHVLDVDGDGIDDLLLSQGDLTFYFGTASGLASDWPHTITPARGVAEADVGDLDQDGYDDVVFSAQHPAGGGRRIVYWLRGSASGPRQVPASSWAISNTFALYDLAVLDANGDGYDDVAVGSGDPASKVVEVLLGSASGPTGVVWSTQAGPAGWSGFSEAMLSAGDLDGDGFEDLVLRVRNDNTLAWGVAVVRGGPAGLAAPVVTTLTTDDPVFARAGDTDRDGDEELVLGIGGYDSGGVVDRGVVALLHLGATGRFGAPLPGAFAVGTAVAHVCGTAVVAGDFDGSGTADFGGASPGAPATGRVDVFYSP